MTVVGLYDFVKVSISASFKSFLLIICIDGPESTTNSRSSGSRFDEGRHLFSEGEKNVALFFSINLLGYIFGQLPRCFTGTSLLPFRLFLRPILKFWSIGVTLTKITWVKHSKRRILVSNVSVTYNGFCEFYTSDWLPYVWALPQNRWRLRRLHILRYATQLSCNFQQGHCTFVTVLFRPFARLFINLTMRIRALFPKSASIFGHVEQAFWKMPFFTEWSGASSFEVILALQSSHFPTWASASGTSGSWCSSHILPRRRSRRRIRLCRCCTLIHIVSDTAIVSFRKLPVSFPIANNLQEFFVHAVLFPDSWPRRFFHHFHFWRQNSDFENLARYFFLPLYSICVIVRFSFLLMNLHFVPFQYGLEFLRLWYS